MRIFAKLGLCLSTALLSTAAVADINFNGTVIPSADITSISIDPQTGDVLINVGNDWAAIQGTVEPPAPPPPPPPPLPSDGLAVSLVAFDAETNLEATTVDQWTNVTFTWQSSEAVRCVTRRGTAEWLNVAIDPLAGGSATIQMTEFGTDIPFRVFCFDAADAQVAAQVVLTVNEAPAPEAEPEVATASCDGPSEVPFGVIEKWNERVGSMTAEFPVVLRSSFDVFTRRNDYYALEFTTTDAMVEGSVTTVSLSSGVRHVAISQCPGNFQVDTPPVCEQRQGIGESLQFTKDPTATGICVLEPNTRYYLNVTYADIDNRLPTDTSSCNASSCATRINIGVSEL